MLVVTQYSKDFAVCLLHNRWQCGSHRKQTRLILMV
jgi:hypothetical protein